MLNDWDLFSYLLFFFSDTEFWHTGWDFYFPRVSAHSDFLDTPAFRFHDHTLHFCTSFASRDAKTLASPKGAVHVTDVSPFKSLICRLHGGPLVLLWRHKGARLTPPPLLLPLPLLTAQHPQSCSSLFSELLRSNTERKVTP